MIKKLFLAILSVLVLGACKYDDSAIWEEIMEQQSRIKKLENWCSQLNSNISALQSLVLAIESNDFVKSVTPIIEGGVEVGYTISFTKSDPITIYHGIDGKNGIDGTSPIIGIKQNTDSIYYWTLNGEWLLNENGDKIRAVGLDGTDGLDGMDGITPQLKIEEGYWYISYDNEITWIQLGQAVGEDVVDGDSFFESLTEDGKYVRIKLTDGTEFVLEKFYNSTELLSLKFLVSDNKAVLIEDLKVEIDNNIGECLIPHIVPNKMLIPTFEIIGESVLVNDQLVISGETQLDFSKPVTFNVIGEREDTVSYVINVRAFTRLPVIYIDVANGANITSKETYKNAQIRIIEDITTRASGDVFESPVKIKGRGNSTWNEAKKPYKLKFDEKVSLFGEAEDKEWVLLANHLDHTMIRTELAMFMGHNSLLDYTTSTHYAELFLNNKYLGTYQVAEQQKISSGRVNVTDEGFLIEVDAKAEDGDITFRINTISQPLNIKDPDVEVGSEHYNNIVNFMTQVETALYSDNWLDKENGWQKYMDMDSFVDWYLINEIARNNDAVFFTSCYMHHAPGGKLHMGPLWDFDLAFGNYGGNSNVEGFYIKDNVGWYIRLFTDPVFKERVKERYEYFYSMKDVFLNEINMSANYLELSAIENNNKWDIWYSSHAFGNVILGAYYNEVNFLKQWLIERMEWLKEQFEAL